MIDGNNQETGPEVPPQTDRDAETEAPTTGGNPTRRSGKDGGPNGPMDLQGRTPSDPNYLTAEQPAERDLPDAASFDKTAASRIQPPQVKENDGEAGR
jgi:hypothetical protein